MAIILESRVCSLVQNGLLQCGAWCTAIRALTKVIITHRRASPGRGAKFAELSRKYVENFGAEWDVEEGERAAKVPRIAQPAIKTPLAQMDEQMRSRQR